MNAVDLSNIIIAHFNNVGDLITNKKLQKLLYYVEAWSLVHTSSVVDEDFEAWIHGPVVPSVYHNFKRFSYSPIIIESEYGETTSSHLKRLIDASGLDQQHIDLIFNVLDMYGSLPSYQLEALSHSEKPWLSAREGYDMLDHCSVKIDKPLMKEFYSSLIK